MTDTTTPAVTTTDKPFWQSQTVWASVFAVAGALAPVFGYTFDPTANQAILEAVGASVTAISAIFAIVGRFKAGGIFIRTPSK